MQEMLENVLCLKKKSKIFNLSFVDFDAVEFEPSAIRTNSNSIEALGTMHSLLPYMKSKIWAY